MTRFQSFSVLYIYIYFYTTIIFFYFNSKGLFTVITVISLIISNINDIYTGICLEYLYKKRHKTNI